MNAAAAEVAHVACLCAAWCRLCDDYAAVFERALEQLARTHPSLQAHWIDIEDEADLVGDLEVETFPTLAILDPSQVRFFGPLTPQPETLQRVLRAALEQVAQETALTPQAPELMAFADRLRRRRPGRRA